MENVYSFIRNLNIENKCVVAAISGGPDSMLLIDILNDLKDKLNIKIVVAHVHHNLRKESDGEAIKVKEYCEKNNLTFEMKKIDEYPNNKFSEEVARRIRYEFFDDVVKKHSACILFTAHHGDDLIETILMRLIRGSSLKGYAGFERISTRLGYKIARPLTFLTKEEILEILKHKNVWFATDMSNTKDDYTRNRFRKYILPVLKKENKNVHYKFIEFNQKILEVNEFIKRQTDAYYGKCVKNNEINVDKFNKLDIVIKESLLECYLKKIYNNDITLISSKHVNIILNYLCNKTNLSFDLPHNKLGIIEYNKFKVVDKTINESYEYTFLDKVKLPNGKSISVDNSTNLTSNYVIHLNSSEIKLPFHVRNKKDGDKMIVKNMKGSKKVSDIFTDFKLSKHLRATYPVVTDSTGRIIWIPGIKKSNLDRKKEEKYDIILKYNEEE